MPRQLSLCFAFAVFAGTALVARQAPPSFYPVADIRPGQVAIGRTVYAGDTLEEFKANILGVLRNVIGPGRDLILARLEGAPLENTGVIQGMSGSPVYIDGRLVGAVSYSLGSFPKAPIAGITPIGEMTSAVQAGGQRIADASLQIDWSRTSPDVFAALERVARRAASPLGSARRDLTIVGPSSLADLASSLRPIGSAMVVSGFEPEIDGQLRQALGAAGSAQTPPRPAAQAAAKPLRPGDAVGVGLMRGDLEMGATGTVTHVDGNRVYAFGHPFLNLGPTSLAMTQARVIAVLPSLDSSLKIASLGDVIGVVSQDRATAIGGILGPGPKELEVNVTLSSDRAPDRHFAYRVLQDQTLTPLFTYVAVLNTLAAYERQAGVLSIAVTGTVSFGNEGQVSIEDQFTGDSALTAAASTLVLPIGAAATNDFKVVLAEKADFRLRVSEKTESTTIERVWLDTTKPKFGETYNVQALLRDYRGTTETVSIPVTMPRQASGPLTLVVSDSTTLATLEQRDLRPGKPTSWPALLARLNDARQNNRIYVRLLTASTGTVVAGETLPGLPTSIRTVLDADPSVAMAPVPRAIVGSGERRLDRVVRGSRELTITLTAKQ